MADDRSRPPSPRHTPGRPPSGPRPWTPRPPGAGGGAGGARPGGGGFAPRTPFTPAPRPVSESTLTVRLREGDREVEVSGPAGTCRQLLDELPALFARLRGERPERGTPAAIALPPPAALPEAAADDVDTVEPAESDRQPEPAVDPGTALDESVVTLLRAARAPLTIAEIRRRLPEEVGAQAVRRSLERAGSAVVNTGGRPAAYRAR